MTSSKSLQKGYSEEGSTSAEGAGGPEGSAHQQHHFLTSSLYRKRSLVATGKKDSLDGRASEAGGVPRAPVHSPSEAREEENFVPLIHDHFYCNRILLNISGLACVLSLSSTH